MSVSENSFKGDRALIHSVDVDGPLAQANAPCCDYYTITYVAAARQAEEHGDVNAAHVYRFLHLVTSFRLSFEAPTQPFVSFTHTDTWKGFLPSDLTPDDIAAIRELSKATKDPSLRSRLCDLLWVSTKDHKMCQEGAHSYIEAAERLNVPGQWTWSVECYRRGLSLAAKLGRKKDLFKTAVARVQQAARNAATDSEQFRCCYFLEILVQFACGDPSEFAEIAARQAQNAANAGNQYATRHYREVEAEFHKLSRNPAAEIAARLAAAETHVLESENRAKGPNASALSAAWFLQNGIEALRQAGEKSERIDELRKRLTELQRDSAKEMKTISTHVDLSKAAEAASVHVKGSSFQDTIFKFSLGHPLSDLKELHDLVIQTARDHPLMHLFNATIVDSQGRTTAKRAPLLNLEGEEFEAAVEAEMFSYASKFDWPLRVSGYVDPARQQLLVDHHPTLQDLLFLVQNHSFIPPGHEGIFLRGIYAGFHGDFLAASNLLVPQIENSMLYVLKTSGVDFSNSPSDGTQAITMPRSILRMAETKAILGEPLCFELRGCLVEKTGYNFRNRVTHGFVSEAECCSVAGVMLWWLIIRILATPVLCAIAEQEQVQRSSQKPV